MNEEDDDNVFAYDPDSPSKSQRKRDMHALRDMGERLLELPEIHVRELLPEDTMTALLACKKINKGMPKNANCSMWASSCANWTQTRFRS